YTIVRATQFFEFVGSIAQAATVGQTVRLPAVLMQPMLSDDVVVALAEVAIAAPLNNTIDIAGPESIPMDELVRQFLIAQKDPRTVVTDPTVGYFGTAVTDRSLRPAGASRNGATRYNEWLSRTTA